MLRQTLCCLLVFLGLFQVLGYLANQSWLKGLGVISVAAPLPIVFTEVKGVEIFAQDFYIKYEDYERGIHSIKITPELYSQLNAPYNLRNVVGAAVSYGPIMPVSLSQSVLGYAFNKPGNMLPLLGIEKPIKSSSIYSQSRTFGRDKSWTISIKNSEGSQ